MNENREEKTFKVSCGKGAREGEYALSIEAKNAHASLSTWCYDYRNGNLVTLTLFSLTSQEISDLARLLSKESQKIALEVYCSAATEEAK